MHEQPAPTTPPGAEASRARVLYAGAAFLVLGLLVAAVLVLSGGSGGSDVADAPAECLENWNADESARNFGVHNALVHGYSQAQVLTLTSDDGKAVPEDDPQATCTVVFASNTLDPERAAAGQIYLNGEWQALSDLLDTERLSALQGEAVAAANATLTETGELESL